MACSLVASSHVRAGSCSPALKISSRTASGTIIERPGFSNRSARPAFERAMIGDALTTQISATGRFVGVGDDLIGRLLEGWDPVAPEGVDELRPRQPGDLRRPPLAHHVKLIPLHRRRDPELLAKLVGALAQAGQDAGLDVELDVDQLSCLLSFSTRVPESLSAAPVGVAPRFDPSVPFEYNNPTTCLRCRRRGSRSRPDSAD